MVTLITNADDFGMSTEINRVIFDAFSFGTLTSTTILAGGEAFGDAVRLAKLAGDDLGIGVHLALSGPYNLSTRENSIVDANGKFRIDNAGRVKLFRAGMNDLVGEYSLQIEKVLAAGIRISHLDHHQHVHRYKRALDAMIVVAKKYGIRYIRPQVMIQKENQFFLNRLYRKFHRVYLSMRIKTIDGYVAFETKDVKAMVGKLQRILLLKKGVFEIMLHPANPIYSGDVSFLMSEEVRNMLRQSRLTNYREYDLTSE